VNVVRRWWRQGDHFDWLTLYLTTRGIRLIWRAMIAAVIASIAVVPAVVLVRPTLPHYPAAVVVAPVASGFGVTVALFWLIRWPTGRLKICRNEVCSLSFYDRSRNNSGVYHDSRVCGNAMYLRASRARKRQGALNTKQDTKDAGKR
jgi:predicted RNA-binding Zn ribbon-like protein